MSTSRPNILLIVTDQQRGDCLSLAGHPVLRTPHLDSIGASGTHFLRAYSEVPSCIAARQVLMSGMAPDAVGMLSFYYRNERCPWNPPTTLAGELHQAGYETRMIGKLHLQPQRRRYGFDTMELADGLTGEVNDYVDWLRAQDVSTDQEPISVAADIKNSWTAKAHRLPEEQTNPAWVVTRAIDFLEKRDPTCPFFLNLSIFSPHPPLIPSQEHFDHFRKQSLPGPVIGDWVEPLDEDELTRTTKSKVGEPRAELDAATMQQCRAGYFGLIRELDSQVGRLLDFLGQNGLDNTFIIFVSDHGEMLGDHHLFDKCEPFEGSANIPFLVRAPGSNRIDMSGPYPRGLVCSQPVGLQDVMPTLLEIAGVAVPKSCTGLSILPLLRGDTQVWRDVLHGEHSGYRRYEEGFHFLVSDRWKYIWRSQTGRELLFDLAEDPQELHDLSREVDMEPWRRRMAKQLEWRPEGFSEEEQLVAGRPHRVFVPGKGPEVMWGDVGR
jgi:arylsulfatase